jgi:hypothetical protein
LTEDLKADIKYWKSYLDQLSPTKMIPDHIIKNVGWVWDASTAYGIGVIIGKKWGQCKWCCKVLLKNLHCGLGTVLTVVTTTESYLELGLITNSKASSSQGSSEKPKLIRTTYKR